MASPYAQNKGGDSSMRRIILVCVVVVMAMPVLAASVSRLAMADDAVGRYQMAVTENNAGASSVLILDTRDGHLWEWTKSHPIAQQPKEWIAYVGKLTPGSGKPESGTR